MTTLNRALSATLLFLLLLGFSACDTFLEEEPFSQTSDAQFWQNNGDARGGIAAMYDAMQETYRLKYFLWGEFRSDNHIASDRVSVDYEELVTHTLTPTNTPTLRWNDLYLMISRANLAIQRIPEIPNFDRGLLGQAHAARAFAYFDAIRVWGAVPLFTEPITGLNQDLARPRTAAAEIMSQIIIPDMLRAEELITAPSGEFRFTRASVWALQADVHWWNKDYEAADAALQKIIDLDEYELVTDRASWSELFLNDLDLGKFQMGPELIFSIRYDLLEDGARASGNYELFFAGIPSFFIDSTLEKEWVELFPLDSTSFADRYPGFEPQGRDEDGNILYGDWRYYESREDRPIGEARVAKYTKANFSPNDDDTNIPVYRYSGILLKKALLRNELDDPESALDLVNQVRVARQLPQVSTDTFNGLSKDEREDFILFERQIELLGEGKRWWDLRATDKAIRELGPVYGLDEQTLLFPIFEDHLIDNPALSQNPGY